MPVTVKRRHITENNRRKADENDKQFRNSAVLQDVFDKLMTL